MEFMDKLLKTESRIRRHIENLFGDGAGQTPLEVRRDILEQVEAHILIDKGGKAFPFGRILIYLHPQSQALRDVFQAAFLGDRSLENDIREMLKESGTGFPHGFTVSIELEAPCDPEPPAGGSRPVFTLEFISAEDVRKEQRPRATLIVLKGVAEQPVYQVDKDRVLIGRLGELLDREGQMTRRNDIVFLDNGEEINSTIGRAHAAVYFDRERRVFRITDEVSRYGTRIFRDGRTIEVPGGNPRGIRLRSGDEIHLGRGCLRFEIADANESAKE
jgi:hypothetical protein